MPMMNNIPDMVDVIIEEQVPIVMTAFGTPKPYMPTALKEAGIKVIQLFHQLSWQRRWKTGAVAVGAEGMESGVSLLRRQRCLEYHK